MRWVAKDLSSDPDFRMDLVVTGSHFSDRHGMTIDEIMADGHASPIRIPTDLAKDEPATYAVASAKIVTELTAFLAQSRPDIMLALGDRWELLAAATACLLTRTPIGHFAGGEKTEGAFDDSVRHAVTKLSHLHFVANETYAARVRQLGEEDWRICVSGNPGSDNFFRIPLLSAQELGRDLGVDLTKPTALVAFHCPTLSAESVKQQAAVLVEALREARIRHGLQYVVTAPAADPGAEVIETTLRAFVESEPGCIYVASLGTQRYISLLKIARLMIGNSSSAFHEAPFANLPAVNIGDRQRGRIHGGNVVTVDVTVQAIMSGIDSCLAVRRNTAPQPESMKDSVSAKSRAFLKDVFAQGTKQMILRKSFTDLAKGSIAEAVT
jgi:UDP-hydrolysing UDP-N-acetyl-D-glucosamine 2-epimerase